MENKLLIGYIVLGIALIIGIIASVVIFKHFKAVLLWLRASLQDPETNNASSKRLSGLWGMILVTTLHIVWLKKAFMSNEFSLLPEILYADLGFVTAALGISAWTSIVRIKNEKVTPNGDGK